MAEEEVKSFSLNLKQFGFIFNGNWYTFKGDKSVKIVLAPFWKGSTLKEKNLLLHSFLLE